MQLFRTKRDFHILSSFIVASIATTGWAAQLDSSSFNHKYEGDVVPVTDDNGSATPAYATGGSATSGPTSDGDILTYQSSAGNIFWESNASIWAGGVNPVSDANGWTIEFRVRIIDDAAELSSGAFQVFARDGDGRRYVIGVKKSGTDYRNGANVAAELDSGSNTDGFHTFRIANSGSGAGNTTSIWRDGIVLLEDAALSDFGPDLGSAAMFFGDGSGSVGGPTVELDYFRWDSTGAYEPVPEPTSIALAGTGLLLLALRRRQIS